MQDSALCSAHRAKATQADLRNRNVVPDFAVEKTSGSTVAVTKQDSTIQHIFSWTLVYATDNFEVIFIFKCNTTLFNISVKVRNINVDLCLRINGFLRTEKLYLISFSSA